MTKQVFFTLLTVLLLTACEEPPQWKETVEASTPVGTAPTISTISNQITAEDTAINNIAVVISDTESTLSCQGLTFISGNPTLVRTNRIIPSGTAPNCRLAITPESNQVGYADITVIVRDPQNMTSRTQFSLQVTPVNDPPLIASITAKTTLKSTPSLPIQINITDIDSSLNCALLVGTSSNQGIVANSGIAFTGSYPACQLVVTPVNNQVGTLQITVQISDGSATSTRNIPFEVLNVNLPPTISQIDDQNVAEDFSTFTLPFSIQDQEAGLDCVTSMSLLSSDSEVLSLSQLQLSGIAPNCQLQINPKPDAFGFTDISLIVSDGSTQVTEVFRLNVSPVNDPPIVSAFTDTTMTWNTTYLVDFSISDVDDTLTCSTTDISITSSYNGLISPSDVALFGTAPDCTASITPSPGMWGTTLLTFEVSDGQLATQSLLNLRVQSDILLSASASIVASGSTVNFSATGGSGTGYVYTIVSGGGSINSSTGEFSAPATASNVTVRVTDSAGDFDIETIAVYEAIAISPLSSVIGVNRTQQFSTTGGYGSITYSVTMGNGSITATGGLYTAAAVTGSVQVTATDSLGGTATASLNVVSTLSISPTSLDLPIYSTAVFSGGGGQTAFSFSVATGSGLINPTTGVLTAATSIGSATVEINDQSGQSAQSTVNYIRPVKITAGNAHSCALYNNGRVKCWGAATNGKLGQGNTTAIGDSAGEIGGAVPFVNLGTDRTAIEISAGANHNCAILDNGSVKCWGLNTSGQLGLGDTQARGDGLNEMGNSLPAVNLGLGRTAKAIAAGSASTCAILDNDALKCWGAGANGILGKGNVANLGDGTGEMGDALTPINLGTNRYAVKIALSKGTNSACAILDNNDLKCWGANASGRLGYGDLLARGDGANEMGDNLLPLNLGAGKYAIDISMGNIHNCALLNDSTVKCWGEGDNGRMGIGSTLDRGDGANEMGDSLPAVNLGTSFTPAKVELSNTTSCVVSTIGSMKCFGAGTSGIRASGNTTAVGATAASMGNNLALSNIGDETIVQIAKGYAHACAILSNDRIKCWGSAASGALLNQSTTLHLGDGGTETGNNLPFVNH